MVHRRLRLRPAGRAVPARLRARIAELLDRRDQRHLVRPLRAPPVGPARPGWAVRAAAALPDGAGRVAPAVRLRDRGPDPVGALRHARGLRAHPPDPRGHEPPQHRVGRRSPARGRAVRGPLQPGEPLLRDVLRAQPPVVVVAAAGVPAPDSRAGVGLVRRRRGGDAAHASLRAAGAPPAGAGGRDRAVA